MNSLLDILLFPKALYRGLTAKKTPVFFGILFVGAANLGFTLYAKYSEIFSGKSEGVLNWNIILSVIMIVLLGFVDVIFLSVPLFDLFKLFRKANPIKDEKGTLTKLMKVYILSLFLIVPVEILIFAISLNADSLSPVLVYFAAFCDLVLPFWFAAIITRGINSVIGFGPVFRRLVYPAVLVWTYVLSYAFGFAIDNWVLKIFR